MKLSFSFTRVELNVYATDSRLFIAIRHQGKGFSYLTLIYTGSKDIGKAAAAPGGSLQENGGWRKADDGHQQTICWTLAEVVQTISQLINAEEIRA